MSGRSGPGLAQWLIVTFSIFSIVLLLYQLFLYGTARQLMPAGLEVAGVDVGGYTREEAEQILMDRFLVAPIVIHHQANALEISPGQAEFELDLENMMVQAEFQRDQQDFWAGFWGFLWNRPVEVDPVQLIATHNQEALVETIQIIAGQLDNPSLPAQPDPQTMSFQYGGAGTVTDINASLADVEAALYRARDREAHLVLTVDEAPRPEFRLLERLVLNRVQEFEDVYGAVASVFIVDLSTGEEMAYNANVPMSAMSVLKVPLAIEALRAFTETAPLDVTTTVSQTLVEQNNDNANALLAALGGPDEASGGVSAVTSFMWELGLSNSFITCPFDDTSSRCDTLTTPANTNPNPRTAPDPLRQTTAEDIGTMLMWLYQCAVEGGGALLAAHASRLTSADCAEIITYMQGNRIGSLLEEGIPSGTPIAHRHGWQGDTYADAGIIFSPAGDYIIVQFVHKPGYLDWGLSSPLIADISRATYNFFNFDDPYVQ